MTKEIQEFIEKIIEEQENEVNLEILKEQKVILNRCFGIENNQIIKPNIASVEERCLIQGVNIKNHSLETIKDWLSRNPEGRHIFHYKVIIRFPEVKITNSRKEEHTIYDLYVVFTLSPEGKVSSSLMGTRGTFTTAEYLSGYAHSHLPCFRGGYPDLSYFCTGEGEINQSLAICRSKFTTSNFMMFCIHIKNFVEWESLEGTPYIRIAAITNKALFFPSANGVLEYISIKIMDHIRSLNDPNTILKFIKSDLSEGSLKVNVSEEGKEIIGKWIEDSEIESLASYLRDNDMNQSTLLCVRDSSGKFLSMTELSLGPVPTKPILEFKGSPIHVKILNKDEKTIETKKFPLPEITEHISEKLSRNFTYEILCDAAYNNHVKENPTVRIGKTAVADQVSMPKSVDQGVVGNVVL